MAEVLHFGGDEPEDDKLEKIQKDVGTDVEATSPELDNPTRSRGALNLRLAGASYAEIADVIGYASPAMARMSVEKALAAAQVDDSDKSSLRAQMSMTLDKYHQSIYPSAIDSQDPNQLAYMNMALRVVDRKIKLHGLDAPTKLEVMPSTEALEEFARDLAAKGGYAPVVEGDPFEEIDMEEGPDGEWHPKEVDGGE